MKTSRALVASIDCLISEPEAANADTETLICLHGIGGDHTSFAPQSDKLGEHYRVVAWNMPGYQNSAPLASCSFELLANSLLQFIDALDVGSVHIAGQSIGGMIAQEMFHSHRQYFSAKKIKSLILTATTAAFGGRDDSFKQAFLEARLKPLDAGMTMRQIAEAAIPGIVGEGVDATVIDMGIDAMAGIDADVYRDVLSCLVTFDRRVAWQEIDCPTLLVAGSKDTNAPAATMKKMADKLPHAHYEEIAGAGHLVNLEKGDAFNDVVKRFFSSID